MPTLIGQAPKLKKLSDTQAFPSPLSAVFALRSVFTQRFDVKIKLPVTALEAHIVGDFLTGRKKAEKRRDSSTQNIAW